MSGHFDVDGHYLQQRYPEVLLDERYKLFTFIRDPLEVKLSLISYEKKVRGVDHENIEVALFDRPNYIANRFPANLDNYKEVIDRYFFVGILEYGQQSIEVLRHILNKPYITLPQKNISRGSTSRYHESKIISSKLIEDFKAINLVDYKIYAYCCEKFHNMYDMLPNIDSGS